MLSKVAVVPLAGLADTGGGVGGWKNPEAVPIIITRLIVDVTVVATGACTLDAGTTPTGITTLSDNLIDGADVHTATGLFDNLVDVDVNGKAHQRLASGKWVTFSKASGASAGLVGKAYIHYHRTS